MVLPSALADQRFPIRNSASFGLAHPERSLALVTVQSPRFLGVQRYDAHGRLLDPETVPAIVTLNHRDPAPDGSPQAGTFLSADRYTVMLHVSMAIRYDLEMNRAMVTLLREALTAS